MLIPRYQEIFKAYMDRIAGEVEPS
jgi:hypothetical protein